MARAKAGDSPFWWLRWVPAAVITAILLWMLYVVGSVAIVPVLASFALAYLLDPLVTAAQKRGFSRSVAAILVLVAVSLAVTTFAAFVIPSLWHESVKASDKVSRFFTPQSAKEARRAIRKQSPMVDRMIGPRVEEFLKDPAAATGISSTWIAGGLSGFLAQAAAWADLFLVPFFVYYLLVSFQEWRSASEDLIPERFRPPLSRLLDEIGRILQSYVRGQLLIAVLMSGLYALGFLLFQVPAWAGIAAISGLLNAIPYVGTTIGFVLATALTLATGGGWWYVLGVLGVFICVQAIEGYVLTPRILGDRLNLHPMAVFLALLIGGKLFGLLGVILAVPVTAVAKVCLMFARELYKASYFYHQGENAPLPATAEPAERLAQAADVVLAEQEESTGDELLAPQEATR